MINHHIEIRPPTSPRSIPLLDSCILMCGACNGRGFFLRSIGKDKFEKKTCSTCEGHRLMIAEVQVQYKPFKNGNED